MNKTKHKPAPRAEFRVAPFWFLNHALEPDEMRRQVRMMHEAGLGGFFMHARHGRITPYMSEEWMRNIAAAVDEARRLGMRAWIYDEDNWPSGSAGGLVGREFPCSILALKTAIEPDTARAQTVSVKLDANEEFFCAAAIQAETRDNTEIVTPRARTAGRTVAIEISGRCRELLVFVITRDKSQPDLLNPKAGQLFVNLTHRAYLEKFGGEFGKTIPGAFFDEPWFTRHDVHRSAGRHFLPWTDGLDALYKKKFGRNLKTDLPLLFRDCGDNPALPRLLFHKLTAELFVNGFFKPIHRFCRKHNLLSIGHLPGEDRLDFHAYAFGDFFGIHKHTDWPGTDTLWGQLMPTEGNGILMNCVSCKMAASAAHVFRKERVMSEEFGCAHGWKFSPAEMKPLHDLHVGLGVNYIIPHGFYYSVQGFRKWECIPSHFFHQPYWPFYREFARHSAEMCALFSGAAHKPDAAVLYPIESIRACASAAGLDLEGRIVKKDFEDASLFTLDALRDYDYLPEDAIQSAVVEHGCLAVNRGKGRFEERFPVVILPAVTTLHEKTWAKLLSFCRAGGRLVFTSLLPFRSAAGRGGNAIAAEIASIFKLDPAALRGHAVMHAGRFDDVKIRVPETGVLEFDHSQAARLEKPPAPVRARVGRGEMLFLPDFFRLKARHKAAQIRVALDAAGPACVTFPGRGAAQGMICARYARAGETLLFVMNTTEKTRPQTRLRIAGGVYPELVDTEHGARRISLPAIHNAGRSEFALDFAPRQARVVALKTKPLDAGVRPAVPAKIAKTIRLSRAWRFTPESPNTLPLTSAQLEFEIGSRSFTTMSQDNTLVFRFRAAYAPKEWALVMDGLLRGPDGRPHAKNVVIELNGRRILDYPAESAKIAFGSQWDPAIDELRSRAPFRNGVNTIKIVCHELFREPVAATQPLIVAGGFSVKMRGATPVIQKPVETLRTGSWAAQGYPFYSGMARYEQDFRAPAARGGKVMLRFESVAEAVEVSLNGRRIGALAWAPFEIDVSNRLKPALNRLSLRVANTIENRFAVRPHPSGILGGVYLDYRG